MPTPFCSAGSVPVPVSGKCVGQPLGRFVQLRRLPHGADPLPLAQSVEKPPLLIDHVKGRDLAGVDPVVGSCGPEPSHVVLGLGQGVQRGCGENRNCQRAPDCLFQVSHSLNFLVSGPR